VVEVQTAVCDPGTVVEVQTAVCVTAETACAVQPVRAVQVLPLGEDWKLTVPVAPDVTVAVMVRDAP
jgi:hypothetical protein